MQGNLLFYFSKNVDFFFLFQYIVYIEIDIFKIFFFYITGENLIISKHMIQHDFYVLFELINDQ